MLPGCICPGRYPVLRLSLPFHSMVLAFRSDHGHIGQVILARQLVCARHLHHERTAAALPTGTAVCQGGALEDLASAHPVLDHAFKTFPGDTQVTGDLRKR